jgi:hypothetical protein
VVIRITQGGAVEDQTQTYDDELSEAAQRFARAGAGDDDAAYVQLFTAAYNAAHWVSTAERGERRRVAGALLEGMSLDPALANGGMRAAIEAVPSLYDDPTFVENDRLVIESSTRMTGGMTTNDFPDCVAVGTDRRFCCTGTLIAPSVVLTAAHCHADHRCSQRVFVGNDVNGEGGVVAVNEAILHAGYRYDIASTFWLCERSNS